MHNSESLLKYKLLDGRARILGGKKTTFLHKYAEWQNTYSHLYGRRKKKEREKRSELGKC